MTNKLSLVAGFVIAVVFNMPNTYALDQQALLAGENMAVAYSGFREGQHPDRGDGAINPSDAEILEDLQILLAHDFQLIRMYDAGENTQTTLRLIKQHQLPIRVLLGIWLEAEVSNHEGCPWLDKPIPKKQLQQNMGKNQKEVERGVTLANQYPDIVVAVNVGNEALVEWNDHMVTEESIIDYIRYVRGKIAQPVTVADNYDWWIKHGEKVAEEVDFIGVHTYPIWENKTIVEALDYTKENILGVQKALPNKPIAVLEAGWATTATEFPRQANEDYQIRYFNELMEFSKTSDITIFFFEAFDEPWKGNPGNPQGAEKHWGLFFENRAPKKIYQPK